MTELFTLTIDGQKHEFQHEFPETDVMPIGFVKPIVFDELDDGADTIVIERVDQ